MYIKSRLLLPVAVDFDGEDLEDPRKDLVDRLIEYQKFKKLTSLMEEKEAESEWSFERKRIQTVLPLKKKNYGKNRYLGLVKTFSTLVSSYNSERILDLYEEISVSEK